jgi:hypothetical protein
MIIHCTKKLAAKLLHVSDAPLDEPNPLGSWHANLYTIHRRNCVMFCHDKTRFVLFMAGLKQEHFANLDYYFQDLFANTLLKSGYDTHLIEKALVMLTPSRFDTHCNRSVQGSMRTVRMMELETALYHVADVMALLPYSTSAKLNDRPVTVKGMKSNECLWPLRDMEAYLKAAMIDCC